jgi:hypothetical protein
MPIKLPHTGIRWFAALLHLFLGVVLFALISALLLGFWFPPPFFTATGGWQGLKLIAMVVVLGPLLTLVVANPLKARRVLARDLGLIVSLQCLTLAWFMYALYGQRPVAVVFWESEFYTVTAHELAEHGYSVSELNRFGKQRPVWVYRPKPAAAEGLIEMLKQVTVNQVPPHHQVARFLPYREHFSELTWHSVNIGEITRENRNMQAELDELLQKSGNKADDYLYLALKSKYRNVVVVFTKSGERIGYLYAPYLRDI